LYCVVELFQERESETTLSQQRMVTAASYSTHNLILVLLYVFILFQLTFSNDDAIINCTTNEHVNLEYKMD